MLRDRPGDSDAQGTASGDRTTDRAARRQGAPRVLNRDGRNSLHPDSAPEGAETAIPAKADDIGSGRADAIPSRLAPVAPYIWTFFAVALITLVGKLFSPFFDITNVTLFYLLPVLLSAVRWGLRPSLFASFLGVLAFDFFFVPPVLTFAMGDIRYVFTFA
ncbi:MAG: DUF4118 domain-containing protein, partial [Syntrophorhabdales bacterium]